MISKEEYLQTDMGRALQELNDKMQEKGLSAIELNVVGGFAMITRGFRDISTKTDIDYVGYELSKEIEKISSEIGTKYNLGRDWINNELMLSGISIEDFELSTGKLHFEPAFEFGKIKINVLEEDDLLRMKLISLDTAYTAVELGGDFTRMKDIPDVLAIAKKNGLSMNDLYEKHSAYIQRDTIQLIEAYKEDGSQGVDDYVYLRGLENMMRLNIERQKRKEYKRSSFMDSFIKDMFAEYDKREHNETPKGPGENGPGGDGSR